tara:strand:+ start:15985 stop:16293 length:309 start_codon:yes stop_codon:yes gene_type:complete
MKGFEQFIDLIAIGVGMIGAMVKGLKKKLKARSILLGMCIAGILSYSLIGVVEIFYNELTPRLVILVSFVVGWIANELTEKIDLVFEDLYQYLLNKLKHLIK